MSDCWTSEPSARPSFLRLEDQLNESINQSVVKIIGIKVTFFNYFRYHPTVKRWKEKMDKEQTPGGHEIFSNLFSIKQEPFYGEEDDGIY